MAQGFDVNDSNFTYTQNNNQYIITPAPFFNAQGIPGEFVGLTYSIKIYISKQKKAEYSGTISSNQIATINGHKGLLLGQNGNKTSFPTITINKTHSKQNLNFQVVVKIQYIYSGYAATDISDKNDYYSNPISFSINAKPSYTITYNEKNPSQTKWHDEVLNIPNTIPTKTGYTFTSWKAGNTLYYPNGTIPSNVNQNLSMVSQWLINTYTITYNANGGTDSGVSSQTKTYNSTSTYIKSQTPTKVGFDFNGWSLVQNGAVVYQPDQLITHNQDIVLYANWKKRTDLPSISSSKVYRCDSAGSEDEERIKW